MDAPHNAAKAADADRDLHALALNSGSSSLKFGLYRIRGTEITRVLDGEAEGRGLQPGSFHAKDAFGKVVLNETFAPASQEVAIDRIASLLAASGAPSPQVIGHRIVHGGPEHVAH